MGRSHIFEGLFSAVSTNAPLLTLLGPQTPTNRRTYRSFPQLQSFLVGPPPYEPQGSEGWLVLEEVGLGQALSRAQYDSILEIIDIRAHVFATQYGLADDVFDLLDAQWHFSIEQQRDLQYGNYYVFFSRAFATEELYAEDIKLPHKIRSYRMELVLAEQVA